MRGRALTKESFYLLLDRGLQRIDRPGTGATLCYRHHPFTHAVDVASLRAVCAAHAGGSTGDGRRGVVAGAGAEGGPEDAGDMFAQVIE